MPTKPSASKSLSCPSVSDRVTSLDDIDVTSPVHRDAQLWVKFPPEARGNLKFRVWSKHYVDIRSDFVATADSVSQCALVSVHKSDHLPVANRKSGAVQPILEADLVFKKWITPANAVVFHCKSRTQCYGFTVCISAEPLIHFGAASETELQEWISAIRQILWPPSPFIQLEKTLGSVFEISVIDNEYAYRAGLLGTYGHLTVTTKKVILVHPQTGHVIQEWYLDSVGFKLLPQTHQDDQDKVVTMITDSKSSTGYGTIVMYCKEATGLIERLHAVRQLFAAPKSHGEQLMHDMCTLCNSSGSEYATATDYEIHTDTVYQNFVISVSNGDKTPTDGISIEPPPFSFTRPLSDPILSDGPCPSPNSMARSMNTPPTRSTSLLSPPNLSPTRTTGGAMKPNGSQSKLFSWRNVANIPETMLDSSMNFAAMMANNQNRPISETKSSSSSSGDSRPTSTKVDFYIGDDGEQSKTQLTAVQQQKSINEEDEDDSRDQFYLAIADKNELYRLKLD